MIAASHLFTTSSISMIQIWQPPATGKPRPKLRHGYRVVCKAVAEPKTDCIKSSNNPTVTLQEVMSRMSTKTSRKSYFKPAASFEHCLQIGKYFWEASTFKLLSIMTPRVELTVAVQDHEPSAANLVNSLLSLALQVLHVLEAPEKSAAS